MSTPTAAAAGSVSVADGSLWWDSFTLLLNQLQNATLPTPIEEKLKNNRAWFLDTVRLFKPPNPKSKEALGAAQIKIGSHQLAVEPELKDLALRISSLLSLDEVQSYILVKRKMEHATHLNETMQHNLLHMMIIEYYVERQCLLKCTRQILMHASYAEADSGEGLIFSKVVQGLISDGLENSLLCVLEELLCSSYPEHMDPDLYNLWAEETLIEDNLVLDILFIAYYEFLHPYRGKQWKKLCQIYKGVTCDSYNFDKLEISTEAIHSISHAKATLLLILIETLDLESLLQMIHDNVSFRKNSVSFPLSDIQEIDTIISALNPLENREVGPIMLAWATFLCLISSLPDKPEDIVPFDIDHVGYVHQAIEGECLGYFLQFLQNDILEDPEAPVAGYRSVVRTLISSFIAAYEISLQSDDINLKLILDILHQIYRGEESLCTQFWDRDSFVDGPIRSLLYNLEGEFPLRAFELVRLLSALCEGTWPTECVFNFLDKSVGLSSLFELNAGTMVDQDSLVLEQNLPVPGAECLTIPIGTRGRVMKMINRNTALVRWERSHSGMLVLLIRFAQGSYMQNHKEALVILDLLSRLATFNMDVCYALMNTGRIARDQVVSTNTCPENYHCIDVVELLSTSLKYLPPSCSGAELMSMGVKLLTKMLRCLPSHVSALVVKANIFDLDLETKSFCTSSNVLLSGSWMLSRRLDKMLLIDCEHNCSMLTLSVLDFTMELVEVGPENDVVIALIVFSLQYVMVNHEFWKYKVKHTRWKVTLKVLELFKKCILLIPYRPKLSECIQSVIFRDSSVHNALVRIICMNTEDLEMLYVSRLHDQMDIEGLQEAVDCGLDVLSSMLSIHPQDLLDLSVLQQVILSPTMKPIPVVAAVVSFISCFHDPKIQLGSVRSLSSLCSASSYLQGSTCLSMDDKQISNLSNSINTILCEKQLFNEDLIIETFKLLTSAAQHQPALLVSIMSSMEDSSVQVGNIDKKQQPNQHDELPNKVNLVDSILSYVKRSDELIHSKPIIVLNLLQFLKSLWHGASEFLFIMEQLRNFENFWKLLSDIITVASEMQKKLSENQTESDIQNIACMYQCQSDILELMAYEGFTQRKLAISESTRKQKSEGAEKSVIPTIAEGKRLHGLKDIFSSWSKGKYLREMIKSFASCKYDSTARIRANASTCLFVVDVMRKLKAGEEGSLSISLVEKISTSLEKFKSLPAFTELTSHYAEHGYSKGKDAHDLVIDDLFHHLRGEFEGRQIDHRAFKDLSQYLKDTKFIQAYLHMRDDVLLANGNHLYLHDISRLQADTGLHTCGFSELKESKSIAEMMLSCLQDVNSAILLETSKISALNALVAMFSVHEQEVKCEEGILGPILSSCVGDASLNLITTVDSLAPAVDADQDLLYILVAQAELIFLLVKFMRKSISSSDGTLVLRSSGYALKVLCTFRSSEVHVRSAIKVLLTLILLSVELSSDNRTEVATEASNISLGLLPILCNCIELSDCCSLSLTAIDLIVKAFSTPRTWFPVIQKHLQFRYVIQKLQDEGCFEEIPSILKFLLTLARVKEGADMIIRSGFFASLRVLFAYLSSDGVLPAAENEGRLTNVLDKTRKPQHIWGLSLAVVAAVVCSLGDGPSNDIVEHVMFNLFVEKAHIIHFFLKAPGSPYGDHDKKRARAMTTFTSLSTLKETEDTMMLMCVLAKYRNSWIKVMKEVDSQLRESSIHLLAFISRANQSRGDSLGRLAPLLCHPMLKEELEWFRQPSFVDSRNGWFSVSPLGCKFDPNLSSLSSNNMNLILKDQTNQDADLAPRTHFSDTAAIQIYRITFLLLQFLCIQAKGAAKRAEEVGFVDVSQSPELPMPDILHGLQDQGITIVTELCEAHKSKQVASETQDLCLLLLQITNMALYLEYCVVQNCGMRPVLGRMEDFSKELGLLLRASSEHMFLRESIGSLKQIVLVLYPVLVNSL